MAGSVFRTKSIDTLLAEARSTGEGTLKRTLGPGALVALGIGAIIGAGLFVRTAAAIADRAGPSVTLGFIVAGVGCAFAGLCYAEFASMIPIAGSAYTYSYATMGELVAWIIGWDLVLEYAVGAATVAIAWSEYLNKLLEWFGMRDPVRVVPLAVRRRSAGDAAPHGHHEPAGDRSSSASCSLLLIRGIQESAIVNGIIVIIEGRDRHAGHRARLALHQPGQPHAATSPRRRPTRRRRASTHAYGGIMGILGAAGVVFFAFIGFDAVSTAAQEAKNPKRDMPIGILGSLVVCTVLYILFSHVLTGIATVEDFRTHGPRGVGRLRDHDVHARLRVAVASS